MYQICSNSVILYILTIFVISWLSTQTAPHFYGQMNLRKGYSNNLGDDLQ